MIMHLDTPPIAREFPIKYPRARLQAVDLTEIARLDQLPATDIKPNRVYAHTHRVTRQGPLQADPFEIPAIYRHQAD